MRRSSAILVVLASLAAAPEAADHEDARTLRAEGAIVALEDVLRSALALHSGRTVEVELERKRDGYQYEVEVVDHGGQVWEMRFDARTGALLRDEQER